MFVARVEWFCVLCGAPGAVEDAVDEVDAAEVSEQIMTLNKPIVDLE